MRMVSMIILSMLLFATLTSFFPHVVAQKAGLDIPSGHSEMSFKEKLSSIISGRAIGFIPRGSNDIVVPDPSGIFELESYDMPPVRIGVGGVKDILSTNDLGQIIIERMEAGENLQTTSFATNYKLSFDLLFQTELSNINSYLGAYRTPGVTDLTKEIMGAFYLLPGQWSVTASQSVVLPNFVVPASAYTKLSRVAEGTVIINWNINMENTEVPAKFINTTSGDWIRNDLFSYWLGIKGAFMGDIVSDGITGYYTIEADTDINALQEELDRQTQNVKSYTASGSGSSHQISGWYGGLDSAGLHGIDRMNAQRDSSESGLPLFLAINPSDNTTVPSELPFYDPQLGDYLGNMYSMNYIKLAPRITEWVARHKIFHGRLFTHGFNWLWSREEPYDNIQVTPTSLGFTMGNTFRRQEAIVNMQVRSYYDFKPNIDVVGGLSDPNETNGNLTTDVFGTGSLSAGVEVFGLLDGIWTLLGNIIMLLVAIIAIYVVYTIAKRYGKGRSTPQSFTEAERKTTYYKIWRFRWVFYGIIIIVAVIVFITIGIALGLFGFISSLF